MDLEELIYNGSTWIIPALLAITLHEAGHAFAAWKLGDPTAKSMGRVTLNPIRHIDPFGTIILPGMLLLLKAPFLFGYAKPVPVNFGRLGNPRRDMVLVALAGPGMNFLLAFLFALGFHFVTLFPEEQGEWVFRNLRNGLILNVVLGVFNLLPIPPLDGGKVAVGILPNSLALPLARLERYGFFILIAVIFLLPIATRAVGYEINILRWVYDGPISYVVRLIANLAGLN
ncbi:site-2 protease family protein [Sneathiella glossodoripedis]|uniref:site-2 protease family protein n=1 Tax=Sneathiella glossodoripedis TaxID=418853 RepID=UPI000560CE51|nr:site-2 protease family protein [Sneathiella glossodoripedis]